MIRPNPSTPLKVVELFAGVGGFALALQQVGGFKVVWSNQWEPAAKTQFASDCYERHFKGPGHAHVNDNIETVLETLRSPKALRKYPQLPKHDLLVGGFPCQDYSVAKPLNQAHGIEGKKGILWWSIYTILDWKRPRFVLLENVDRLLNSPGDRRGRDFAIILSCLATLGYRAEWRVINAADYGFPQRRRRVFIFAQLAKKARPEAPTRLLFSEGVLARAFPIQAPFDLPLEGNFIAPFGIPRTPQLATKNFGAGQKTTPFRSAGVMQGWDVWTDDVEPDYQINTNDDELHTLGDVVSRTDPKSVPPEYFIEETQLDKWKYLKGAKNEKRTHKGSNAEYFYTEGALPFPDPLERPARTILTAEGGTSASRFKHVVQTADGRLRRLIPEELEELNGFPRGWTAGMGDLKRSFCMGNALVVGVVRRIADEIRKEAAMAGKKRALAVAKK